MTSKLRRSERDSVVPTALCDYLTLFSLQAFRALLYIPAYNLTPLQGCDSDIKKITLMKTLSSKLLYSIGIH